MIIINIRIISPIVFKEFGIAYLSYISSNNCFRSTAWRKSIVIQKDFPNKPIILIYLMEAVGAIVFQDIFHFAPLLRTWNRDSRKDHSIFWVPIHESGIDRVDNYAHPFNVIYLPLHSRIIDRFVIKIKIRSISHITIASCIVIFLKIVVTPGKVVPVRINHLIKTNI